MVRDTVEAAMMMSDHIGMSIWLRSLNKFSISLFVFFAAAGNVALFLCSCFASYFAGGREIYTCCFFIPERMYHHSTCTFPSAAASTGHEKKICECVFTHHQPHPVLIQGPSWPKCVRVRGRWKNILKSGNMRECKTWERRQHELRQVRIFVIEETNKNTSPENLVAYFWDRHTQLPTTPALPMIYRVMFIASEIIVKADFVGVDSTKISTALWRAICAEKL